MSKFVSRGITGKKFRATHRIYKRNNHSEVPDVLGYYPIGTVFTAKAVHDSSGDIDYNTIQVVEMVEEESGRHVWIGLGAFAVLFEEIESQEGAE